ncbi:hypothetical protein BC830DRAFT_1116477 [Chytriomyces sp. MP71]|nr:hypothetical protein BC830DRAFT_1116477 [Chytriomyces sp. MP71]
MASAYPSHSSILSSTTQAVVSSLSFFTSSSSTPAPMNSHADYRTPTSSTRPKIATAYPGQNSLLNTTLNSTKAVVTKLASAVSSASARTAGADKPTTPHGYGYADVRGGMRDSSSTLYERVGTSSSSWSKANDSWGGFADEQESVGVSVGMYGGSMPVKRGSIGTGGMDTTGRNTSQ